MYKHWDEWTETAPHPFLCTLAPSPIANSQSPKIVNCVDLLEGTPYESPMKPFGGVEQLAWSPDGKTIAYTCRKKSGLDYAISTNSDIYLYDLETGTHTNLTEGNGGYDTNPSYSPDGQWIAWQSMERDGYESDENRLMIQNINTGERRFLTQGMETNVDAYYWKDNNSLVFSAVWHGCSMLYEVGIERSGVEEFRSLGVEQLTTGQYDYVPGGNIGDTYYCLRHSMREANEIFSFEAMRREGDEAKGGRLLSSLKTLHRLCDVLLHHQNYNPHEEMYIEISEPDPYPLYDSLCPPELQQHALDARYEVQRQRKRRAQECQQ
jgi:dipeptidyl aminopeptidase/acylaminoacyl peptidase